MFINFGKSQIRTIRRFFILSATLSVGIFSTDVLAIQGGARCTRPYVGGEIWRVGTVSAGQEIDVTISISCVMSFTYPFSMNLSQLSGYRTYPGTPGPPAKSITVGGVQLTEGGFGTQGNVCPIGCGALEKNYRFYSSVNFKLNAGIQPGYYEFKWQVFGTHRPNSQYSDEVNAGVISYTVESPACALVSPTSANIYFGAFSGSDISTVSQAANIELSCKRDVQVTAKLAPSQRIVNAKSGISATTLNGLSMASSWSDTGNPVDFSATRTFNFKTGNNSMGIRFNPRINDAATLPVGDFSSNYTLTLNYQ